MTIKSLQSTSLTNNIFYRSMLAGNDAYFPEFESDDFLEEVVLTTSASSVTFSGLGAYSDYKHLQIRFVGRTDIANTSARDLLVRLNADTGNSYAYHNLYGTGSEVNSRQASTTGGMFQREVFADGNNTTGVFGAGIIDILDFSSTSKNTTIRTLLGVNATSSTIVALSSGLWNSTSAVTSVTLAPNSSNLVAGTRFSLYGSKG